MKNTMTFAEKLNAKVQAAQEANTALYESSLDDLLNNHSFIETQRAIQNKQRELRGLNMLIMQLNQITPYIANDGTKYKVQVYPINFFNTGLSQILGIISASRSAFTDDLMMQYSAITGISEIELAETREALGSPAYCAKDGTLMDAIPGDHSKLNNLLQSIAIKLEITEFDVVITADRYELWFIKSEMTAHKKASAITLNTALCTTAFTMEG